MATIVAHHERLAENDEILFPRTDFIDTEPFYENFTTINRSLAYPTIDGHIFNLIRIVEQIGLHPQIPWINSLCPTTRTNELFYLVLQLGGAYGPLTSVRRVRLNRHYFQRWYLEKCSRSASLNRSIDVIEKRTTQISDDHQSPFHTHLTINTPKQMDEKHFQNDVLRMYGFDDLETNSSNSSRRSSIDGQTTPTPSESIELPKGKQQITIREYYPRNEIEPVMADRSISSSEQTLETVESDHQEIDDENDYYEQMISNDPELFFDPNPEIITKENPEQVTYKQNVSIRYLMPPTPPPSGPLIIRGKNDVDLERFVGSIFIFREILPPRVPTPPPLVIQQQDPTPPTPPPLILREAPPILPVHQEAEIITKMLPPQPPPARQVIMEQTPPVISSRLIPCDVCVFPSARCHRSLSPSSLKNGCHTNHLHPERSSTNVSLKHR